MTSTPLMERPRNDRTYSAVVPGLVPTAFTHLAWRFRGGDKYRCRPGACPRVHLESAPATAGCGLLLVHPRPRGILLCCPDHRPKTWVPGTKSRDASVGVAAGSSRRMGAGPGWERGGRS